MSNLLYFSIMDFNQFKPMEGERYIIVENGEPVAVLISFKDYQKFFGKNKISENKTEKENLNLQNFAKPLDFNKANKQRELTIEDLPF